MLFNSIEGVCCGPPGALFLYPEILHHQREDAKDAKDARKPNVLHSLFVPNRITDDT